MKQTLCGGSHKARCYSANSEVMARNPNYPAWPSLDLTVKSCRRILEYCVT